MLVKRHIGGKQRGERGTRGMRVRFSAIVTALTITAATGLAIGDGLQGSGDADQGDEDEVYAIGLWGDLPYSAVQAQPGVLNLIDDMNHQPLAFSVHDGDLKAGNGPTANPPSVTCDDNLYTTALSSFNALKAPAIFTPGDNDWTDCDRASNGGFWSLERLDHERKVFFSTPFSLGQRTLRQDVQTEPLCYGVVDPNGSRTDPANRKLVSCAENRRWTVKGVTYATLNIQGSCNNLCDTNPDPAEYAARTAANIKWMQETFDVAQSHNSAAIMFISQADPGFDNSDASRAPTRDPKTLVENDKLPASDPAAPGPAPDGFHDFLVALRDEVIAFQKPVAYVHGDSHYFRVDKPFQNEKGQRLENFTRVETFGDNAANGLNDVHWVKVRVAPQSREVFSYQPQIVPENRVAVPAP